MPNRLQYLAVTRTAAALNPLLIAMDSKGKQVTVDYAPLFKGVTSKNLKERSKQIVADAKKLLKGKTIAKDAPMEHFAELLRSLESSPDRDVLDESVSSEQHKAMEAAAHGHSNLGIPKDVGAEFSRADVGKSFDELVRDWAKDRGFSEDDFGALKKMHEDSMPENALDESEETEEEREVEEEREAEDEETPEEKAAKEKAAKDKAAKDKAAKDKAAKDRAAMDKKVITEDEMNKAIAAAVATERKIGLAAAEAREFVRPYVGEVSMALDSAEKIHRAAAVAMSIEDAETIPAAALKTVIKLAGRTMEDADERRMAQDSAGDDDSGEARSGFDERWGDSANRIGHA